MNDRIELLQGMAVFGGLSRETLGLILQRSRFPHIRRGQHFFRAGDQGDAMYVLESGTAAAYQSWDGVNMQLRRFVPGDCFGEMALMDFAARTAAVIALEDCQAIELTPATLQAVYEIEPVQYTMIQMNMGREVARRLRETNEFLFRIVMGEISRSQVPHLELEEIQGPSDDEEGG